LGEEEVGAGVGEVVHPLQVKTHLVQQFMAQIADLEMFIHFLLGDAEATFSADQEDCGWEK